MSQSLHATPTSPHFGFNFDGRMNVKPFAQRKEDDEGLISNREKSIAPAASEYDKSGVKVNVNSDNHHQQQQLEKGQGVERKKSLAGEAETEDEDDHSNDNAFVLPIEVEGIHDPEKCNACCCALGAPYQTPAKGYLRRLYNLAQDQPSKPSQSRLPERPKRLPRVDPQKARENLIKNLPYMMRSN